MCADLEHLGASAGQEGGMLLEAQDLARESGGGLEMCTNLTLGQRESCTAPLPTSNCSLCLPAWEKFYL